MNQNYLYARFILYRRVSSIFLFLFDIYLVYQGYNIFYCFMTSHVFVFSVVLRFLFCLILLYIFFSTYVHYTEVCSDFDSKLDSSILSIIVFKFCYIFGLVSFVIFSIFSILSFYSLFQFFDYLSSSFFVNFICIIIFDIASGVLYLQYCYGSHTKKS